MVGSFVADNLHSVYDVTLRNITKLKTLRVLYIEVVVGHHIRVHHHVVCRRRCDRRPHLSSVLRHLFVPPNECPENVPLGCQPRASLLSSDCAGGCATSAVEHVAAPNIPIDGIARGNRLEGGAGSGQNTVSTLCYSHLNLVCLQVGERESGN